MADAFIYDHVRTPRGRARNVSPGLADRIDATEHHVVDAVGVELVAVANGGERLCGER